MKKTDWTITEKVYTKREKFQLDRIFKDFCPSPVPVKDYGILSLQNGKYMWVCPVCGASEKEGIHGQETSGELSVRYPVTCPCGATYEVCD